VKLTDGDYPCPCCGYMSFDAPPGSGAICPICFWEDDGVQLRYVLVAGAANTPSLFEAQQNFARFGAAEECFVDDVRKPVEGDFHEADWRPLDASRDAMKDYPPAPETWPGDVTSLYYWRRS
jgi:hypothetical protein